MLYHAYQAPADGLAPVQAMARAAASWLRHGAFGLGSLPPARRLAAACQLFAQLRLTHHRPEFDILSVRVGEAELPVREEVGQATPFATLLRCVREDAPAGALPPVLVAAPLSGHFATLLRDTVRTLLADHDVYVTDWHNARDVPLADGDLDLDDVIDHIVRFTELLGPDVHMMSVCQPWRWSPPRSWPPTGTWRHHGHSR